MSTVSCPEYPELQEKIHRLAMARDSLSLQVSVLNEQVGAQKEKIRDLESILAVKRYSYEMPDVSDSFPLKMPSKLELFKNMTPTERTDLMKEITALKSKYTSLEKDKQNAERRLHMSQQEIERLSQAINQLMNQNGNEYHQSNPQQMNTIPTNEMEQLRTIVKKLIVDNEQKSIEISSLRTALDEHSRVMENLAMNSARSSLGQVPPPAPQQQFNINAQLRKLLVDDTKENIAHSNSFPTSLCSGSQQSSAYESMNSRNLVQPSTSYNSSLSMLSPQPSWSSGASGPKHIHHTSSLMASSSAVSGNGSPTNNFRSPSSPAARQLAAELDELRRMNGEFSIQQHGQYSTSSLPRQLQPKARFY